MTERPTPPYIDEPPPERPIPTYLDGTPAYGAGAGGVGDAQPVAPEEDCPDCTLSGNAAMEASAKSGRKKPAKAIDPDPESDN